MTGVRFVAGAIAWNSDPELYSKTSAMSPVDSRVLTRLSPSPPPGRVSSLTVMSGLASSNALITASAIMTLFGSLLVRNVISLPEAAVVRAAEPAAGRQGQRAGGQECDRETAAA